MSLLVPDVGERELLARLLYGRGQAISAATNASPTVITSNAHGLSNGDSVNISDAVGNTNINGSNLVVNNVAANTFEIATISGTALTLVNGNGALTGSPSWSLAGVEDGTLKLRTDGLTPAEGDTAGTYTEATFTGYSAKTLSSKLGATTWAAPSTASGTTKSTYGTTLTWTATSTQTVTGYFVVGATSGLLWWAENFAASQNLASGITLNLSAAIQLD